LAANDSKNHLAMPIAMNISKQQSCFALPQSGSAERLSAFRHPIVIIIHDLAE
jgi:hypothetical protein